MPSVNARTNSTCEKISIRIIRLTLPLDQYVKRHYYKSSYNLLISTKWVKNIPTTIYISLLTHNLVYHKIHGQCYIHISFSTENNVSLYVQFSNYSRPILAFIIIIRVKINV